MHRRSQFFRVIPRERFSTNGSAGIVAIFMIQWSKRTRNKISFPTGWPVAELTIPNFLAAAWNYYSPMMSLANLHSTFSPALKEKGNWRKNEISIVFLFVEREWFYCI